MKNIKLLSLGILLIGINSCSSGEEKTKTSETSIQESIVGNDRDEHGCIGSAGYQWSILKNECIRVFESGIRLDPQDAGLDQTTSAFVIFVSEEEEKQVEVYLPGNQKSLLLNKTDSEEGAGEWAAGDLMLSQWRGMYTLDRNGKTIYQGAAVK